MEKRIYLLIGPSRAEVPVLSLLESILRGKEKRLEASRRNVRYAESDVRNDGSINFSTLVTTF